LKKIYFITLAAAILGSACSQMSEQEIAPEVNQQLMGTWSSNTGDVQITFYDDQTAKLIYSQHQPPIKLISPYQATRNDKIGIALGGFWSGPVLIDTHDLLTQKSISARLPDEEAIQLHKQ